MKMILTAAAAMLMSASFAAAQTTSEANSSSNSGAVSGSYAGGGTAVVQQYIDQRAPEQQVVETRGTTNVNVNERQSGTVRNEFAPAVSAPAMGSGHPCGLGNSLGISIIGGGVTGGATRVDDACLLAQMGYTRAATAMIAARNPSACAALVATGEISARSSCGDGKNVGGGTYTRGSATGPVRAAQPGQPLQVGQTRQVSAGNTAPVLAVASSRGPICERSKTNPRGVVTNAPTQQGKMACAATLGMR